MSAICGWFDITPQAHYSKARREAERHEDEATIIKHVQQIRAKHKRLGVRKLLTKLVEQEIKIGRDHLFDLLRRHQLLVKPKRRWARTTVAGSWRCENLLVDTSVDRPNTAWVTDITYLETERGFCYLALVTDLYSRRIVGYDLSNSLCHEGAKRAFNMALRTAGKQQVVGLVHHSDRGTQYTSNPYRAHLRKYKVKSSMGATGNCYDNAVAERVNGILKLEYGLDHCFVSTRQARRTVKEAVWLYNHDRPHLSLQMNTPDDVYHGRINFSLS